MHYCFLWTIVLIYICMVWFEKSLLLFWNAISFRDLRFRHLPQILKRTKDDCPSCVGKRESNFFPFPNQILLSCNFIPICIVRLLFAYIGKLCTFLLVICYKYYEKYYVPMLILVCPFNVEILLFCSSEFHFSSASSAVAAKKG